MMTECEIKLDGKWEVVGIEDALSAFKEPEKRCIECHGRVCAHKLYSNGTPAHFEHMRAHSGCSQIKSSHKPPKSRHPDASA